LAPAQGLQAEAAHGLAAAQGLQLAAAHGLQASAAQGLQLAAAQGLQASAAQGLHAEAAHGLAAAQGLHPPLAAHGLHPEAAHGFSAAHGLQPSCVAPALQGFGFASARRTTIQLPSSAFSTRASATGAPWSQAATVNAMVIPATPNNPDVDLSFIKTLMLKSF
jgi:hypothetical protein